MADTNPHNIGSDKTIVSLTALQRYHHQLLEALGLVHDTAAYKYKGTRTDFPEGVTSISGAIDSIYDLAKSGGVTFTAGKSDESKVAPIMFTDDDQTADNIVYINAKVGDNTFNIGLDTSSFVKDSVLKSVFLLTVVGSTTKTYKANGVDAAWGTEEGKDTLGGFIVDKDAVEALAEGTYFYYTWITDKGETGKEYQFTSISLKDVYGDIKGDDTYITYDKSTATISANTAVVNPVKGDDETVSYDVVYNSTAGKIVLTNTEDPTDIIEIPYIVGSDDDEAIKGKIEAEGYTNVEISGGTVSAEKVIPAPIEWKTQVWDEDEEEYVDTNVDALATTDNLKYVADKLQGQIDTLAQGTLTPGEITLDDEISKSEIQVANNKINIKIAVASEDEISALFQACVPPAESIEDESTANSGAPIFTTGEFAINVGEQPEGSETNITWTPVE